MSLLRPYKVNSYRRLCDICGRPRQIEDIRFSDGVAICNLHPQFRTAQQLNRINARVRPTRILPVPQPKPLAPVATWTAEEAQIFNFVCTTAPFETVDVTANAGAISGFRTYLSMGWALIYLTGILLENRRPAAWITRARAKAIALGDLLLGFQTTSTAQAFTPLGGLSTFLLTGSGTSLNSRHFAAEVGTACVAFCRLYTATGDARYLQGARNAASFIVFLMAVDLRSSSTAIFYGPPANQWSVSIGFTLSREPQDLTCLWGLSLLKAIDGDTMAGPSTTAAQAGAALGFFKSPPARLLSVAIAQIRAFWTTGYGGVNGLTGATPWDWFDAVNRRWNAVTNIGSTNWAAGVSALAEFEGLSSQVTGCWDYLRTLTSTLDATLAPPTSFAGVAGASSGSSSFYNWEAAGLLARITASRNRADLQRIKEAIGLPRARFNESTPRNGDNLYLGPLGVSTSTYLPYTATGVRQQNVVRAARVGLLYRFAPQGFTGMGH